MYEMVIINKYGKLSVMHGENLEELKKVAKRLNKKGCDVEITKKSVVFRIVNINK